MGMFIEISFLDSEFSKTAEARQLVEACPVDIFTRANGETVIDPDQEDECILCDRCLEMAPGKVRITKLYE